MVKNHLKRINTPKTWDVLRKATKFISRPNPGRTLSLCVSLNTALKEMLGKTRTTKESKYLLRNKKVLVNGEPKYDEKFPVGLLDVISFSDLNENYRLLINKKGKLFFNSISENESKIKLSKIINKKNISKELVQINCFDGRNILLKVNDKLLENAKTNDSIVYSIPDQKPEQILKLEKGCKVFLYKGRHIGMLVTVENIVGNTIHFNEGGELYETKKVYALVVGKDKLVISLPENHQKNNNHKTNENKNNKNDDKKDKKE